MQRSLTCSAASLPVTSAIFTLGGGNASDSGGTSARGAAAASFGDSMVLRMSDKLVAVAAEARAGILP